MSGKSLNELDSIILSSDDDMEETTEIIPPSYTKRLLLDLSMVSNQELLSSEYIILTKEMELSLHLDDNVINKYMTLITKRSPDTVYVFDTFFYYKLSTQGYSQIKGLPKKVDIFSKKKLFFPIHSPEEHWCLIVADLSSKKIKFFNSLREKYLSEEFVCENIYFILYCFNHLKRIMNYLMEEHKHRQRGQILPGEWSLEDSGNECPNQTNSYDCGVFICIIAEYLARGATLDFSNKDMGNFREKMNEEITDQCLYYMDFQARISNNN